MRVSSVLLIFTFLPAALVALSQVVDDCQLLIVGGSTAALGAALSASVMLDTRVCLLEPTDWAGGQLSSELLSAPDFAFHTLVDKETNFTLPVGQIDRQIDNQNPLFYQMLQVLGDSGKCWVSPKCSIPDQFHSRVIEPLTSGIRVFYNTVVKNVTKDATGRRILRVDAIQRTARPSSPSTPCRFLSAELPDWYSESDSDWFSKTSLAFGNVSFVVEGSSWGEVLVLANASYLQGLTEQFDGDTSAQGNDQCGQSFTFDFLQHLSATPVDEPPNPLPAPVSGGNYSFDGHSWENIWTYRRVNTSSPSSAEVATNDLTIQNWGKGNDYGGEFFFLSAAEARRQRETNEWQGGVNTDAIEQAERQAYGYHHWYRAHAPSQWANRTTMVRSAGVSGTCHGLAKMPYLRESRRSIGIDNFLLNVSTISGHARDLHGVVFPDRLCLGAYDVDIHPMARCNYPSYMLAAHSILPYFVPLRALTNRDVDNLLVVGKTMAQTFLVNSATRLHPVEFAVGQAAGVASAYAVQLNLNSVAQLMEQTHLQRLQALVKTVTPTSWTIDGKRYPDD